MNRTVFKLMYSASGKTIRNDRSRSGFRLAFNNAMRMRTGTWREPMRRHKPCGIKMTTRLRRQSNEKR